MRTLLALAVSLSLCSFGMVGCKPKDTNETKKTEMTKTPNATTTTSTTEKTETEKNK
ncbi:MAG TPA: hypothetical protein VHV77_15800 [Pirellulales bacterium]|nr:hypothetical protein [Pirellulales bacterium]